MNSNTHVYLMNKVYSVDRRRYTMTLCRRCGSEMIATEHHEEEMLGNLLLVKTVSTRECSECGVIVSVVVPVYYQQETS